MYKIKVQLFHCTEFGDLINDDPIIENTSSPQRSIQGAFDCYSSHELFETYLKTNDAIEAVIESKRKEWEAAYEAERGIRIPVNTDPSRE